MQYMIYCLCYEKYFVITIFLDENVKLTPSNFEGGNS